MKTQESKIELANLILEIEDENLIAQLTNLIYEQQTDFWDELSESDKKEVALGIAQLDSGERKPFTEILNRLV